jgi:hypothetical protein
MRLFKNILLKGKVAKIYNYTATYTQQTKRDLAPKLLIYLHYFTIYFRTYALFLAKKVAKLIEDLTTFESISNYSD